MRQYKEERKQERWSTPYIRAQEGRIVAWTRTHHHRITASDIWIGALGRRAQTITEAQDRAIRILLTALGFRRIGWTLTGHGLHGVYSR